MRQRLAGCMEGINGPVTVQAPSLPMWSGDLDQLAGLAQQLPHAAAELDGLVAVSAMLQGIAIAGRGTAALGAAMHPAAALTRHRRRPAGVPGSGPGTASQALVHGVDPHFLCSPLPPG
jgi:hypothetical protein